MLTAKLLSLMALNDGHVGLQLKILIINYQPKDLNILGLNRVLIGANFKSYGNC